MTILSKTLSTITGQVQDYRERAVGHLKQLLMPHWALGRLMDLAVDISGMTRSLCPRVSQRTIFVFSGDHGVCKENVSLYPQEVTTQMVQNFLQGKAAINALARQAASDLVIVDMGVLDPLERFCDEAKFRSRKIRAGTSNIANGPAMTRAEAIQSVETGIQLALEAEGKIDIFGTGDMGIGNTTPSSAIVAAATGLPVSELTGRGTGINKEQWKNKVRIIEQALRVNAPRSGDGIDILAKVGGFEIGGIAGLILGAASLRCPAVVDGFISTAAALIAAMLCPASCDFMIVAHRSLEPGHDAALQKLGLEPLLNLNLRLGEGSGSALAMNIIGSATALLSEVGTFTETGVSSGPRP